MKQVILYKCANIITSIALGVCYLELLKYIMDQNILFAGETLLEPVQKMIFTGSSSLFSTIVLLAFNLFVTRQNSWHVGVSGGLVAFVYFYVFGAYPDFVSHMYMVLKTSYSLFALLAFVATPILAGFAVQKLIKRNGFQPLST